MTISPVSLIVGAAGRGFVDAISLARSRSSRVAIGRVAGSSRRTGLRRDSASMIARVEMRCVRSSLGSDSPRAHGRSSDARRRRARPPSSSRPPPGLGNTPPPVLPNPRRPGIEDNVPERRVGADATTLPVRLNGAPSGVGASVPSPYSATTFSTTSHESPSRTLKRIAMPGLSSCRTVTTTPSPRSTCLPPARSSSNRTFVPGGFGVRVRRNRPADEMLSA